MCIARHLQSQIGARNFRSAPAPRAPPVPCVCVLNSSVLHNKTPLSLTSRSSITYYTCPVLPSWVLLTSRGPIPLSKRDPPFWIGGGFAWYDRARVPRLKCVGSPDYFHLPLPVIRQGLRRVDCNPPHFDNSHCWGWPLTSHNPSGLTPAPALAWDHPALPADSHTHTRPFVVPPHEVRPRTDKNTTI